MTGHGTAGWDHGGVIIHVGAEPPARPWQVWWSEQKSISQESTWYWRDRGHHWSCVCMGELKEITIQPENPSCWVIQCYVTLEGMLLVCCCPNLILPWQLELYNRLRDCVRHIPFHPALHHWTFKNIHRALMNDEYKIFLFRCNIDALKK